jgi:hypothetical protein
MERGTRTLNAVIAALVSFCLVLLAMPTLAEAPLKQCPTAPVQLVAVVQTSDCGCKTVTFRAPKPGDAAFKACQCHAKPVIKAYNGSSKPTLIAPSYLEFAQSAHISCPRPPEAGATEPGGDPVDPWLPPPVRA